MAQLVEYNLAKVGVAGSNPVCRSQHLNFILIVHWEQSYATVAQLVEGWGRGFEPRLSL